MHAKMAIPGMTDTNSRAPATIYSPHECGSTSPAWVGICMFVDVSTHTHMHAHTHTSHMHAHTRSCTHTHTHTHTHTPVNTHPHIHTL